MNNLPVKYSAMSDPIASDFPNLIYYFWLFWGACLHFTEATLISPQI